MRDFNLFKKTLLILLITTLSLMWGCSAPSQKSSGQIFALDTVIDITAYGENSDEALKAAKDEIRRLEKLLSVTDSESDVYRINHADGEAVTVSHETYELIERAVEISELTEGRFDITIYNAVKLWGFTTGEYKVPTEEDIEKALGSAGSDKIHLQGDNTIKVDKGTQIDLGGIAKGYIGDKTAVAMTEAGAEAGLLSLGGNVRTFGTKPRGENFVVGIRHPQESGHFAELQANECAVITSGGYQRNFTEEGVNYHHIINPETGKPSESDALSVTVVGNDDTLCDALSTAIFIGGTEYAAQLRSKYDSFEYLILTESDEVIASSGLLGKATLAQGFENLKIEYR